MSKAENIRLVEFIDENKIQLITASKEIHSNPEIGNQEFFAQKTLGKVLEDNNFIIEYGVASHKTGFIAKKSSSKPGPKIAFLAEYDALPTIGHGCGHNLIGVASVGAGIGIGYLIEELGGEVYVFGTPSEEGGDNGSAKATYVNKGLFNEIDAALMFHPGNGNFTTPNTISVEPIDIEFFGKTAHAASAPEQGINALHALIHFYNVLHSYQLSKFKDLNIHGVILDGGKAPNVIPDYARARFYLRAKTSYESKEAVEIISKNILPGIDQTFGTKSKLTYFQNRVDHFILTPKFDELFGRIYEKLTSEKIYSNGSKSIGSTDASNVSHVIPVIHPHLAIGDASLTGHTIEFTNAAASDKGFDTLILASKLLGLTALELYKNPDSLYGIKENWIEQKNIDTPI
ncbi:MAG: M20 family metallopeptidase [Fusobacteriaceae bacterium]|jgi:amidohydrolase|nr:M20 family metallopeptidase [Fusobacteriaceae bacterium]